MDNNIATQDVRDRCVRAIAVYKAMRPVVDRATRILKEHAEKTFEATGCDRVRHMCAGKSVGTTSIVVEEAHTETVPCVKSTADFVGWLTSTPEGIEAVRLLVESSKTQEQAMQAALRAVDFESTGEIPCGLGMWTAEFPEHVKGTQTRIYPAKYFGALGASLPEPDEVLFQGTPLLGSDEPTYEP